MDYSLSFNLENGGFRIPVNPGSIDINEGGSSKTYHVAGLGEINIIQNPKLAEISFDSLFPANSYPFVVGELRSPFDYIEQIEKWMKLMKPIRFVFAGSTFEINELVSIEKFTWKEVGGAIGDVEYSISLKKYVPYAAKKVVEDTTRNIGKAGQVLSVETPPRPDEREQPKTYTLVKGDNLWKVAQKFLGNGAKYKEIQKLNNITNAQLKRLPIGMIVKLP